MRFVPRVALVLLFALGASLGMGIDVARAAARPAVEKRSAAVSGVQTFRLERRATHVAVYWVGARAAAVRVAFSRDGRRFGRWQQVELDEAAEARPGRETYGAVMVARGARAVRVSSDRRLQRLTVLAMRDRGRAGAQASANVSPSQVISRAGWGADESLRFDSTGKELWPPEFSPVQKLVVHHTATRNGDSDPAAMIRSIYYYHAVTQGWGDIGYNFLVDESGRVYEGRYSRTYSGGEQITGEDLAGNGVTAAHALGYNSGTVGVALLGTLTNRDATPPARSALEQVLAWKAEAHAIDPLGSALYTNPVNGTQKTFPNIAGHRDVNATECPGGVFYSTLSSLRQAVADRIEYARRPSVGTSPASAVTTSAASLNGTVNPVGQATTYRFEYGTTTAYGSQTAAQDAGSANTAQNVSAAVTGLEPGTTYHYRLSATNAAGTANGADQSFTTEGATPTAPPPPSSDRGPPPLPGDGEATQPTAPPALPGGSASTGKLQTGGPGNTTQTGGPGNDVQFGDYIRRFVCPILSGARARARAALDAMIAKFPQLAPRLRAQKAQIEAMITALLAQVECATHDARRASPRLAALLARAFPGGNDTQRGGGGNDIQLGGPGNDRQSGGSGNDLDLGGTGDDRLTGGSGNDLMFGESGNDIVNARDGETDYVSCGRGRDRARADQRDIVRKDCESIRRG